MDRFVTINIASPAPLRYGLHGRCGNLNENAVHGYAPPPLTLLKGEGLI